jgi:hypothetical protein
VRGIQTEFDLLCICYLVVGPGRAECIAFRPNLISLCICYLVVGPGRAECIASIQAKFNFTVHLLSVTIVLLC